MITIDKVQFDFLMEDEYFARSLYGRWDDFCRFAFESIVDEVFSPLDRNDVELHLEHIDLDLGCLPQENFDEEFAYALRLHLEELRDKLQLNPDSCGLTCTPAAEQREDVRLFFYLVYGWLPKAKNREPQTPRDLAEIVLRSHTVEFKSFLQQEAHSHTIQKRMILQWPDEILESIAGIAVPEEKVFLSAYTRCLIQEYTRLPRKEITQKEHRHAVWTVVFAYLFSRSRGHFSRRELVRQTLQGLSAHHAMKQKDLLFLVRDTALHRLPPGMDQEEFLRILAEINQDSSTADLPFPVRKETRGSVIPATLRKKWLAAFPDPKRQPGVGTGGKQEWGDTRLLRFWLSQLTEEETEQWVEILLPEESPFLVPYARHLQKDKEQGMFEGKAGNDFRFVKWEFIIQVSLSSSHDKKRVVLEVLQGLSAHYGLDTAQLLEYFFRHLQEEREDSLRELAGIVAQLWQDLGRTPVLPNRREEYLVNVLKVFLETGSPPADTSHTAYSLLALYKRHPEKIREFLTHWQGVLFSLPLAHSSTAQEWFSVILKILDESPEWVHENRHLAQLRETLYQAGAVPEASHKEQKQEKFLLQLLETSLETGTIPSEPDHLPGALFALYKKHPEKIREFLAHWQGVLFSLPLAHSSTAQEWFSVILKILDESPEWVHENRHLAQLRETLYQTGAVPDVSHKEQKQEKFLLRLLEISLETGTIPSEPDYLAGALFALYKKHPEKIRSLLSLWKGRSFSPTLALTSSSRKWFTVILQNILRDTPGLTDKNPHLTVLEQTLIQAGIPDSSFSLEEKDLPFLLDLFILYRERTVEAWLRSKKERIRHLLFLPVPASRQALKKLVQESKIREGLGEFLFSLWTGAELATALHEAGIPLSQLNIPPERILHSLLQEESESRIILNLSQWVRDFCHDTSLLNHIPDRDKKRFLSLAAQDRGLLSLTLETYGGSSLKTVLEEFSLVSEHLPFIRNIENIHTLLLMELGDSPVRLSVEQWWGKLHRLLKQRIKREEWDKYSQIASGKNILSPGLTTSQRKEAEDRKANITEAQPLRPDEKHGSSHASISSQGPQTLPSPHLIPVEHMDEHRILSPSLTIGNAGLILANPWLPTLFERSGLLQENKKEFQDDIRKVKALFLMQSLLYDGTDREFEEYDLALNRILVGYPFPEPLPRRVNLSPKEQSLTSSLLSNIVLSWGKMKNTPLPAFRESFLLRPGTLTETENEWILNIEPRPYDILLDTLPWGYTMIKYPWMNKILTAHWK